MAQVESDLAIWPQWLFSISLLLYFPQVSGCLLDEVRSALNFLPLSKHGFLVPSHTN